jgi:hypothetical protein
MINSLTEEDLNRLRKNGEKIYNDYFDYKNCSIKIINKLNSL